MDADSLIQIAGEVKTLDQRREGSLAELGRIAQDIGGTAAVVGPQRRGRPPSSGNLAKPVGPAQSSAPARCGKRRSGITAQVVELLKNRGGAYTVVEILEGLKLPKSQGLATTISTTLVRLVKEGRAKRDKERGYLAT